MQAAKRNGFVQDEHRLIRADREALRELISQRLEQYDNVSLKNEYLLKLANPKSTGAEQPKSDSGSSSIPWDSIRELTYESLPLHLMYAGISFKEALTVCMSPEKLEKYPVEWPSGLLQEAAGMTASLNHREQLRFNRYLLDMNSNSVVSELLNADYEKLSEWAHALTHFKVYKEDLNVYREKQVAALGIEFDENMVHRSKGWVQQEYWNYGLGSIMPLVHEYKISPHLLLRIGRYRFDWIKGQIVDTPVLCSSLAEESIMDNFCLLSDDSQKIAFEILQEISGSKHS